MFASIERRDVTLSVDNFIFDIGSLFAEKNPMGTPKYTITKVSFYGVTCKESATF